MKHTNAKSRLILAASIALLASWSCSDDPITGKTDRGDNSIRFSSWIKANDTKSRTINNSKYESFIAEKIENSDKYLITTVEDGIDATKLASYDDDEQAEQTMSRGTKITGDNIGTLFNDKGITLYAFRYKNQSSYNGKQPGDTDFNFTDVMAENGAFVDTYISDEYLTISRDGDSNTATLTPQQRRYWSTDSYRMHFFGLFPSPNDYTGDADGDYALRFENNVPILHHKITANKVPEQRDILCSTFDCIGSGTTDYTASLPMQHIMCGVTVTLDPASFDITTDKIMSVSFSNTIVEGDYNLATKTWTNTVKSEAGTTYSATTTAADYKLSGDGTDNSMFLVIPQSLSEENKITVVVRNSQTSVSKTYTQTLSGGDWPMGKTVEYTLSNSNKKTEYYITPEFDTMYFSWDGTPAGDGDSYPTTPTEKNPLQLSDLGATRVKSYKAVTDETGTVFEKVDWDYTITNSDGTDAKVNNITEIGSDNVDGTDYITYTEDEAKVAANSQRYNYMFKVNLGKSDNPEQVTSQDETDLKAIAQATGELGSTSNYIDLSKYTFARNGYKVTPTRYKNGNTDSRYSANCYMVCCPGYYEIPVVYGNGIYADAGNEGAYLLSSAGTWAVKRMKDRLDNDISYKGGGNCWIEYWNGYSDNYPRNNGNGSSGKQDTYIVWQDVQGMVQRVPYTNRSGDEYYIRFYISKDDIKPGNAVIKVIDPNLKTLWSYHIWVTPRSTSDTFTADINPIAGSKSATFLNVPLGYVKENSLHYKQRTAKLTLTQKVTNGATATINLVQREHTCARHSCTYYQWGRKDAFPGAVINEHGHMYYDERYAVTYEPKMVYNDNGAEVKKFETSESVPTTLGSGILNPFVFYTKSKIGSYSSNRFPDDGKTTNSFNYWDLWGCTYNDQGNSDPAAGNLAGKEFGSSSQKTVYDPCPPGLKVPPILYLPALTVDGAHYNETISPWTREITEEKKLYNEKVNTPFEDHNDFINAGAFDFYCNRMGSDGTKSGTTFTLYAMGGIGNDGNYSGIGTECLYWSCTSWAAAWSDSRGVLNHRYYYLHVGYSSSSTFEPVTGNTESFGYPVLPMLGN